MAYQSVTLKVCEGCGTLWFRRLAGAGVYCAPCTEVLRHFPSPTTRRRPGRPKRVRGVRTYEAAAGVLAEAGGMAAGICGGAR